MRRSLIFTFVWLAAAFLPSAPAQEQRPTATDVDVRLQIVSRQQSHRPITAAAWLEPLAGTPPSPVPPPRRYTLLQKNRMFTPHLLVIPVGTVVDFPNADPFFHNVFSLFDGKRFDLGLYEAGSSKSVAFSREGISYIFCNIHPEMSAVVLSLSTSFYAAADAKGTMVIRNLAPGDYKLHIWIEGTPQADLDRLSRTVHLSHSLDLGAIPEPEASASLLNHSNKFGKPYVKDTHPVY